MNIHDIKLLSNRNSEISLNVIHNVSSIRNDDNNVRRIEDSSLLDIVKADRSLIIFLAIAGIAILPDVYTSVSMYRESMQCYNYIRLINI